MKVLQAVVCSAVCIALVLASGCADTSFGTLKPTDFGSSIEELKALDYYKQKYGEPGQPGEPRFLEPTITTALDSRNLPVDTITSLSADTPRVYFWVFYDRFAKGDPMTITWTYLDNNKVVLTETKSAGGVYGRVYAEFVAPSGGWPAGKHQITITGRGATASKTFDVISGQTVTGEQPFTPGTAPAGTATGASGAQAAMTTQTGGSAAPPPGTCNCAQGRACGNWDGTWHHNDATMLEGDMTICQNGNAVTAQYTLAGTAGSITGTVSGNRITGTWTEYESDGVTPTGSGKIIMELLPGNNGWQAWYTYDNSLPDTTGEGRWQGLKTGTCPNCGGGTRPSVQPMTTPTFYPAVTTILPWQVKTTATHEWHTAAPTTTTTTPSGGACGAHCNDPDRECGLWDARWHIQFWHDWGEGTMELCQDGSTVTGTYVYGDSNVRGSIAGTTAGVTGTELRGTWTEYSSSGTIDLQGAFVFRMKSGNNAFGGWFNYNTGAPVDTSSSDEMWSGTKL